MIPVSFLTAAVGLLSTVPPPTSSTEPVPKVASVETPATPDLVVKKSHYADVTGPVVKISATQITLKVAETVPNGYTVKHVHVPGQKNTTAVQIPKTKVVHNDLTINVGAAVTVKTIAGKAAAFADIKAGETVRVHVTKVREAKPGEKYEAHIEVTQIDVPNTPPPSSTGSANPKK